MGRSIVKENKSFPPLEGDEGGGNYDHYNPQLKYAARKLRKYGISKAERSIWKKLLSKSQLGTKFKRQRPIGNYIVDFFSQEISLIIEIDGSSHLSNGERDHKRQLRLENMGFTVLRITEGEVINNLEEVRLKLIHVIECLKDESIRVLPLYPPPKGETLRNS